MHHLQDVLRPLDHVDVLPAHFYQVKQGARGRAPLNGRPLDKEGNYVGNKSPIHVFEVAGASS